ncbi:MAG: polysaccharide deacetylase family protein [Bowdeniella nasicola]|nr:polysaccharide deacetylase family protein [Bowdeniella nasicola]
MDIPGITTHIDSGVALTFDACGGPHGSQFDADLIATLRTLAIPATLFLNRRWIESNPGLARDLAADPLFTLANHGTRHCPLSVTGRAAYRIPGTTSAVEAWREVRDNHVFMEDTLGVSPAFFRSGTAHYDDVAIEVAALSGEGIAGFSINADAGATASQSQIERALGQAKSGDIVIAHMNQPGGHTAEGFAAALPRLQDAGVRFTHLTP